MNMASLLTKSMRGGTINMYRMTGQAFGLNVYKYKTGKQEMACIESSCSPMLLIYKSIFSLTNEVRMLHQTLLKRIYSTKAKTDKDVVFSPKKALILTKTSRYLYEKMLLKTDSEEVLKKHLTDKGSDYYGLLERHNEHQRRLMELVRVLEKRNIETHVVQRMNYTQDLIDWADVVFSAGGDGTFLLSASKVKDRSKPVIGINTDPDRSEGYLCISKKYDGHYDDALDRLMKGKFSWLWRQRIRITVSGKHANDDPIELHDQQLRFLEHRFTEHIQENEQTIHLANIGEEKAPRVLPLLALNEVFMGESLSARVSYYEISVDGSSPVKEKSSGITVCTGTGSSSWHFNINQLSAQHVKEILKIAKKHSDLTHVLNNENLINMMTSEFNSSLHFDPSNLCMTYTVRDPVGHGIFHVRNPRGFCERMTIRSRMWDASLVVDGGSSFSFNDGAVAELTMHKEDALRTVLLD